MRDFDAENRYLDEEEPTRRMAGLGTGLFRATLLFGSLVLALALVLAPAADRGADYLLASGRPQLDMMATGSVAPASSYTLRRSVLQPPGSPACILPANGARWGRC
ncbi:hypothetical protein [Jiella sp. M17.18]|uniref:hypothetical protein n=1 Tax=Jiella sp. M17.18 TaxID=3234247 RepID=UPI0034DF32C6